MALALRGGAQRVYALLRPGVKGQDLFAAACDVFEGAGEPTQRTKPEGEPLRDGFFHSLGHGVGLQVHEEPSLGRSGAEELVAATWSRSSRAATATATAACGSRTSRSSPRTATSATSFLRARALIELVAQPVAQVGEVHGLVDDQGAEQDRE